MEWYQLMRLGAGSCAGFTPAGMQLGGGWVQLALKAVDRCGARRYAGTKGNPNPTKTEGGETMKVILEPTGQPGETQVIIRCTQVDPSVQQLLNLLTAAERKLVGLREGQSYLVSPQEIDYAESVDKRTFLYTKDQVYESPLKLYELEQQLAGWDFVRAGKSLVIRLPAVRAFRPALGARLEVTFYSGERRYVSRQFVPLIRQKLGL